MDDNRAPNASGTDVGLSRRSFLQLGTVTVAAGMALATTGRLLSVGAIARATQTEAPC
jgi:hypothetical protein